MIKKIISLLICMMVFFSVSAMAEKATTDQSTQSTQESTPGQGPAGHPGGVRGQRPEGDMQMPPDGMYVPSDGMMPQRGNRDFGDMQPDFVMDAQTEEVTHTESANQAESDRSFFKEYQTPIISMIMLIVAFVFVILYKRKSF